MRVEAIVIGSVAALIVVALTIIECIALMQGIDGQLMAGTVGGIGAVLGIVGMYLVKIMKEYRNEKAKKSLPPPGNGSGTVSGGDGE